jgi:hypothetical protein
MALTTAQQALLLFKKWLGLGQTTASREFFEETLHPGRVAVYTNQIWTQADSIPNTAPILTNGQTSGVVQYWQNAPLGAVLGTTNAFTSSLLRDAIPFNYGDGTSYNYVISSSAGAGIALGQGDWIVDTDAGLLTFYGTVPANMPPTISFYKYVGAKGFTSASVPITASLFGTASWANNVISSSFALTASAANSITFTPVTASFAVTASYVSGAASTWDSITNKPSGLVSSSTQINTGSFSGSFRGIFVGDGSQLTGVVASGVGVEIADDGVVQANASRLDFGNFITAAVASNTASINVILPAGTVSSSQQINTGSFSGSFTGNLIGTSSWASNVISASFASTSSRAVTSSFTTTASYAVSASSVDQFDGFINFPAGLDVTGSLVVTGSTIVTGSISATNGFTGSLLGTSSFSTTASFATNADLLDGLNSTVFATTGSNVFLGNQRITGSLILSSSAAVELQIIGDTELTGSLRLTSGGITGSLLGTSSWARNSISSSFVTSASYAVSASTVDQFDGFVDFPNGLDITGSLTVTGSVIVTGSISATRGITGSLFGTSSWASNAISASAATSITFTPPTASYALTASFALNGGTGGSSVSASWASSSISASFATTASYTPPIFIDNLVTVGLVGSNTNYTSIKAAVDSITDASAVNTYTVRVYPGVYIEDTITLKPYIAIKGDSSTSTIVSASNPANTIFVMADQTMVIDMQIQGSTAANTSAVVYSSPTTPQTNAIAYVENVRFGTNYTNAKVVGSGSSGNCILQCSNVKYGGFTSGSKSFDVGFYVTSGSDGGIGRMQLRNVTSTNGGVAGTDDNQIFALADAPGCTFIVNGCLLTRATGTARGTAFKVYNGGQLRLTGVNFQRWIRGIWAPQTGSAPSIDAIALNFENCTTDVAIEHTGSLGKVQGTDNFLKTQIALTAPLYEVGQDPRKITVAKKGGDFSSISASVAYITDSTENNRYIIEVGPGQYTENVIDLTGKPYVSIVGSNIQTTEIFPSQSNHPIIKMGINNEISFLTLRNAGSNQAAIYVDDIGDFAQVHKISIYDSDIGVYVNASTTDTQFYGEYIDINGTFSYGSYLSSSNGATAQCNLENYYLFPSGCAAIGNYAVGPSSSLSLYTTKFQGDATAGSTAIKLERGSELESTGLDIQISDYGIVIPAGGAGPNFRVVGAMIHDSATYDFDVQNANTRGRYQGVSDHTKINNTSQDFYWNFLDDTDGENDVTRKLSVTFADGTHTDATTLIFKGSPMGVMQGGTITTGSGFNITAASGFGYLQDSTTPDIFKRLDWVDGTLTLTANSNNYIYITDTGTLTAAGTIPNNETNIILGRVVTNNTTVEFIDQTLYNGEHMSNKLSTFNREALGPVFAVGSTVTEDVTPFKLDVTSGTYFFSENKFTPAGTSSINLTQYYPSASAWARYTSSVVPNNLYASSSALVAMSASAYTKHTVYLVGDGVDEKYFLVLNSNQYSTLVEAENANLPSIPSYFNDGVVPLAAVYVQSGSANITQIQDIRPIIGFRAAGVNASSVHGNLLGLNADDHTQYLLVNGARAMAGNLSLGGNNITNVGTMFGTASWATNAVNAITASAATSITFTPATASFATTSSFAISASYAPTASIADTITKQNIIFSSSIGPTWTTITSRSQHLVDGTYALTANITATPVENLRISGIFSWYTGSVSSNDSDELFLQRIGRSSSTASIFMRTEMISGSGTFLQIFSDYVLPTQIHTFTFVKLL